MTEPLENSIAHLRALSLHLNDVTDRATAAVRRVETFLNQECRLGLAVYVPVTVSTPDLPTLQLGYARTGERYRVVVRALAYSEQDGQVLRHPGTSAPVVAREEQVAWSECPRATKLEAFQHLPALLAALQTHVADVVTRASAALEAARVLTDALGEAPAAEADADGQDGEERGGRCAGEGRHHGHHHHGHHHDDRGGDERGRHKHHGGRHPGEGGRCPDRGEGDRRPDRA